MNPHAFRHTPLKRTCLPFHHPSETRKLNEESRKARTKPLSNALLLLLVLLLVIVLVLEAVSKRSERQARNLH